MGGEVSDRFVMFGAGVEDGCGVVSKAGEMSPILLGQQLLDMLPLFGIVELEGVIVAGGDEQFAVVVEVERCHRSVRSGEFEKLNSFQL